MFSKLAIRNAKRSFKDYFVYLLTVTISFALIFAFNLIVFAPDIQALSSVLTNFKGVIILVSVIVIFVIGWLINYTMRFMFEKRSKEFGTYLLLGIEKRQICKMFIYENLLLGFLAFFLALFLGTVLSQFMTALIMQIFNLPFRVNFQLNPASFLLTFLYFAIIYLFVTFRTGRRFKKMKIYDLLYLEKQNENTMLKKGKQRLVLFVLSTIILLFALLLFHCNFSRSGNDISFQIIGFCLILMIIGLYGFMISASNIFLSYILKRQKRKYRKDMLFIARNFTAKTNTMGFTLGTLAVLLSLTFLSLNVGNLLNGVFENQIDRVAPFDITVYEPNNNDFKEYLDFIQDHYTIEQQFIYKIYSDGKSPLRAHLSPNVLGYQTVDGYLRQSDYNRIMEMLNLPTKSLADDEILIYGYSEVKKEIKNYFEEHPFLAIGQQNYKVKEIIDDHFNSGIAEGFSYVVVVPDQAVEGMSEINSVIYIDTKENTSEAFANALSKHIEPNVYMTETDGQNIIYSIANITVRGATIAESKGFMTITSFSLMYLAFIFTATTGTILAIQSLSDSTKYRFRYSLLQKLGVEEQHLYTIIRKQLILYFLFPLILPVLISITTTISMNQLFGEFLNSEHQIWEFLGFSTITFMIVYLLYFCATYLGFKRNIQKNKTLKAFYFQIQSDRFLLFQLVFPVHKGLPSERPDKDDDNFRWPQ